MAKTIFVAGIFSLFIVGTPAPAGADTASSSPQAPDGVVEILGQTYCITPDVPAGVRCDWRIPGVGAAKTSTPTAPSVVVLGQRYCFGDAARADCDVRLPAERPTRTLSLFGFDVCFGDAAPGCDVTIRAPAADSRRASL